MITSIGAADDGRRRLARGLAAGSIDWPLDGALERLARDEGVYQLLAWSAGDLRALETAAAVALARRARVTRVLENLAAAGVTALVIKGAHLAHAFYPDPSLRPHVDTDLFIDPGDAAAARQVFERTGHRLIPHVSGRFVMSQFHYVDGAVGGAHAYDVHWQVANPIVFRRALPFAALRARALPIAAFGRQGLGPSIPDALLIACVHRAAHHGASDRLIWLHDIRVLLRAAGGPEVDEFCRLADAGGLNAVCHDACARTADLFGDVAVPAPLAARAAAATEPSRAYLAPMPRAKHLWLDLQALDSWRDRATLLREHVLPPASYMRESSPRGPLAWQYLARLIRAAFS